MATGRLEVRVRARNVVDRARDLSGKILLASAIARSRGGSAEVTEDLLLSWAQEAAGVAAQAEDEGFERMKGPPPPGGRPRGPLAPPSSGTD